MKTEKEIKSEWNKCLIERGKIGYQLDQLNDFKRDSDMATIDFLRNKYNNLSARLLALEFVLLPSPPANQ